MGRNRSRRRGKRNYPGREPKKAPVTTKYADGTYKKSDGTTGHINDITGSATGMKYDAQTYKKYSRWCDHWQNPVPLLDGLTVYASAYTDRPGGYYSVAYDDATKGFTPDIGFYLDDYWISRRLMATPGFTPPFMSPITQQIVISYPWVDRWIPEDIGEVKRAALWLLEQIREGKRVDVGCFGAHGRTGTMIACLLVAQGMPAGQAVRWVRSKHCSQAIETKEQERFVGKLSRLFRTGNVGMDEPDFTESLRGGEEGTYAYGTPPQTKSPFARQGTSSKGRGSEDDAEEYRQWLMLNDAELLRHELSDGYLLDGQYEDELETANERYRIRKAEADEGCAIPPCILPGECMPGEGDCWIARCHGVNAENRGSEDDWKDWDEIGGEG